MSQKRRSRNGGDGRKRGVWGRDSGKWGESGELGGSWREDLEGWREGWRAVWRTDSPDLGKTRLPSPGPKEPASYIPGHIDTCFVHLSRSTVTNVTYRHDLENWTWTAKLGVKRTSCHQDARSGQNGAPKSGTKRARIIHPWSH